MSNVSSSNEGIFTMFTFGSRSFADADHIFIKTKTPYTLESFFDKRNIKWYYKCNKFSTINVTIMELVLQKQVEVKIDNRIAEFRKEKGLSQHSLAKAVGLKRRSIMAYENKTISPTLETAYKICKVLDKDIKQVFIFD